MPSTTENKWSSISESILKTKWVNEFELTWTYLDWFEPH